MGKSDGSYNQRFFERRALFFFLSLFPSPFLYFNLSRTSFHVPVLHLQPLFPFFQSSTSHRFIFGFYTIEWQDFRASRTLVLVIVWYRVSTS